LFDDCAIIIKKSFDEKVGIFNALLVLNNLSLLRWSYYPLIHHLFIDSTMQEIWWPMMPIKQFEDILQQVWHYVEFSKVE